jgi:hypothetical protein
MAQMSQGFFDTEELYQLTAINPPQNGENMTEKLYCQHCYHLEAFTLKLEAQESPHYARAVCNRCGRFIKWVKKPLFD